MLTLFTRNLFMGLALGIQGALLWVAADVLVPAANTLVRAAEKDFSEPVANALAVVGFLVMVGGPILYWLVVPVIALLFSEIDDSA